MSIELKQAAQQALSALEKSQPHPSNPVIGLTNQDFIDHEETIRQLRAAIQQAEAQQPSSKEHLFELWWEAHMPNATQEQAWTAFTAAVASNGVGIAAQHPAKGEPVGYMNEGHIHELAMRRLPYGYVYPEAGAGASTAVYTHPAPSAAVTPEPVVSRNPFASRCYTMSESHLSGHRLIVGFEKLGDAQDAHEWVARQARGDFTHPAPSVPDAAIDSAIYNQCPDFDNWHEGPSIDDIKAIVRAAMLHNP